jgi:hypothetical protein
MIKKLVYFGFYFSLCIGVLAAPQNKPGRRVPTPAKPQRGTARSSLDLLLSRVDRYWDLMLKGNRTQAASFIAASDRTDFAKGPIQQFRQPVVKSFEFSQDPNEVIVTVVVKRTIPPLTVGMDWPVKEHWKFESGTWYRRYDPQFLPLLGDMKPLNTAELEIYRQLFRQKLHFEKTEFDLGSVNQGTNVVIHLKYSLTNPEPIPVTLKYTMPTSECAECSRERGIGFIGTKEQSLLPGQDQKLTIEVPTWNYDGPVEDHFTLVAKASEIEIPFEFTVRGNVYTPLSVVPRSLQFHKGEREKEILIRNNSKKEISINQYISETRAIKLDPFPIVLQPGEEVKVKVRAGEAIDDALPGTVDRMAITHTAVDGFVGLSYKIYLNVPEEKEEKQATPGK